MESTKDSNRRTLGPGEEARGPTGYLGRSELSSLTHSAQRAAPVPGSLISEWWSSLICFVLPRVPLHNNDERTRTVLAFSKVCIGLCVYWRSRPVNVSAGLGLSVVFEPPLQWATASVWV